MTRRLRTWVTSVLWTTAAIATIGVFVNLRMNYDSKLAPFLVPGRTGEPVEARAFIVTVGTVEVAQQVVDVAQPHRESQRQHSRQFVGEKSEHQSLPIGREQPECQARQLKPLVARRHVAGRHRAHLRQRPPVSIAALSAVRLRCYRTHEEENSGQTGNGAILSCAEHG